MGFWLSWCRILGFRFLSFGVRFVASGAGLGLKVRLDKETFHSDSHQEQDIITVLCFWGEPLRLGRGFPNSSVLEDDVSRGFKWLIWGRFEVGGVGSFLYPGSLRLAAMLRGSEVRRSGLGLRAQAITCPESPFSRPLMIDIPPNT